MKGTQSQSKATCASSASGNQSADLTPIIPIRQCAEHLSKMLRQFLLVAQQLCKKSVHRLYMRLSLRHVCYEKQHLRKAFEAAADPGALAIGSAKGRIIATDHYWCMVADAS